MAALAFAVSSLFVGCGGSGGDQKDEPDEPSVDEVAFARGADVSWASEMEYDMTHNPSRIGGTAFKDSKGNAGLYPVLKAAGINAIRLRVWVRPEDPNGWSGKEDVVRMAKRAAEAGMAVMIDFHYSDFFADPSRQNTPSEWAGLDLNGLCTKVSGHTKDVLTALKSAGVTPLWVQVGNETRCGMLWDTGRLWNDQGDLPNGWKNYAQLTTAGYDACKQIFPDALVIVHIDNAYEDNNWFFRKLRQNGGKFDMIGLSHYPMMKEWTGKDWQETNQLAANNITRLYNEFRCPVMIAEIGTLSAQETTAVKVINDMRQRVDSLPYMKGIFYWEPQVYNSWRPKEYISLGWGAYNMGAFTYQGQPNAALKALWK